MSRHPSSGPLDPHPYDALLLVGFGGPEGPEDVVPFLRNVTAGKGIPDERLAAVGEHYFLFGGKSPINEQNLALLAAIRNELERRDIDLPVIWGNRNWHPYTVDTLRDAGASGAKRVLALVTSAYASYSGSSQYREHLAEARQMLGDLAPEIDVLRPFFNDPGFVAANADSLDLPSRITLLRGATALVAPQGTALDEMAFLAPGAAVLELTGPADPRARYWSIASVCGLRYGYVVKCTGCEKDADGNITAVLCEYLPDSKSGTPGADNYKVKGNLHWVSVEFAYTAEVRLYDRLFAHAYPGARREGDPEGFERDFTSDINPNSLQVITAQLEPALRAARPEARFQFERHGYFVADRVDSRDGAPVFNRTVTLRDTWKK